MYRATRLLLTGQDMGQGIANSIAGFPNARKLPGGTAKPMIRGYAIALCLVAVALILTLLLQHLFLHPFLFLFFAAVMGGAWYGGTAPGLFAVLLSTVAVEYFFVTPYYSLSVNSTEEAYFAGFVICSLAASWVSSSKKQTEVALKEARNQLQGLVAERTAALQKSNAELQENERDLQLLSQVPRQIWSGQADGSTDEPKVASLQQVLAQVVEFATSLVKCDSCFAYVLENDELILRASKDPHPEIVDRLKVKLGQGIAGWVGEHREPVSLEENACDDPRFQLFNEVPGDRFEAFLSVPLLSRGQLVGVINLQNRARYRYSEREIRVLSTIGFLTGAEIEMARLESENSQLSMKLESRKLVERAKGIMQRELRISEEEAYLTLQRESRKRGKSMKEIAEAILLNEEIKANKGKTGVS